MDVSISRIRLIRSCASGVRGGAWWIAISRTFEPTVSGAPTRTIPSIAESFAAYSEIADFYPAPFGKIISIGLLS